MSAMSGFRVASLRTPPIALGTGDPNEGQPGTGLSGPRGIESVIEYNSLYMNVRTWVDTYLITQIGGLEDADVRDSRELNPGYHGETPFKGYYGGRTITLTGKIYTKTLFKLRDMQKAMRQAFADLENERPLIFRASAPERDSMIFCKKSQAIQMLDEQRTANHFERAFQITLRASNPRFVSTIRNRSNIVFNAATFNALGFTAVNEGNFWAQPRIELTGPIGAGLAITNEASGDQIVLTGAIPSGEKWVLDIAQRRMFRESDEANRFLYLDVNSDWMELAPGDNPILIVASGLTADVSQVTFYFYHTTI
jgi:phage-related protein